MSSGIHKLTARRLERATPRGLHGDGGELYLQVTEHGSRSWVFRYKRGGRSRMMGKARPHVFRARRTTYT
jgi:hypothetical protein